VSGTATIFWFRRDLRLRDNPALVEAVRSSKAKVLALFVIDEEFCSAAGPTRLAYLRRTLQAWTGHSGARSSCDMANPPRCCSNSRARAALARWWRRGTTDHAEERAMSAWRRPSPRRASRSCFSTRPTSWRQERCAPWRVRAAWSLAPSNGLASRSRPRAAGRARGRGMGSRSFTVTGRTRAPRHARTTRLLWRTARRAGVETTSGG